MSKYRKHRLFPRALAEVVKEATQPLMKKQGQLYTALLRDWPTIIGPERAAYIKPLRVQFSRHEQESATLHLTVSAAKAPELAYMQQEIIEQLARYFGYKAIGKLVLHPSHDMRVGEPAAVPQAQTNPPRDLKDIFERMQRYFIHNKT